MACGDDLLIQADKKDDYGPYSPGAYILVLGTEINK